MEEIKVLSEPEPPLDLQTDKPIKGIAYHPNLNVILVATEDGVFHVVDPTLGTVLYKTPTHEEGVVQQEEDNDWNFDVVGDKVVVVERNLVGIRSEYNGILLLGSILQSQVKSTKDKVQIELSKGEAESLCQSLSGMDSGDPDVGDVKKYLKELVKSKEDEASSPLFCVKKEKWNTVKLELPHCVIKNCVQALVSELVKKNRHVPQLAIASSILERLNMLHPPPKGDADLPLDKAQMFSETARLDTFKTWPHAEYKWALPDKMAQAGFYHNPSANGEDRALCFSCNVCLVSWEPTDEPWSEHERHSPFCPFVRGEHTQNVPLSLSFATAPAAEFRKTGSPILGLSSCPSATVVGYTEGHVSVWEIIKQPKEAVQIQVTATDVLGNRANNTASSSYCDVAFKPKQAWIMDTSDKLGADVSQIAKECLELNVNTRDVITLSTVALLGAPVVASSNHQVPPSVVVGGTIRREKSDSTKEFLPFLVVYTVGRHAIRLLPAEDKIKQDDDNNSYSNSFGSRTGTKQECQHFEEDAFTSYISESDLLPDLGGAPVTIFSDLSMDGSTPESFLEYTIGPLPLSSSSPSLGEKGLPAASKSNKKSVSDNQQVSKKRTTNEKPITKLIQQIDLPIPPKGPTTGHCHMVIKYAIPSLDASQIILIMMTQVQQEDNDDKNITNNQDSSGATGRLLSYNVYTDGPTVRLSKEPNCMMDIIGKENLVTQACFVSLDSGEALLATALRNGNVCLRKLNDLTVAHMIMRTSGSDPITSIAHVASLERLCCGTSNGAVEFYPIVGNYGATSVQRQPVMLSSVFSDDLSLDDPSLLANQPLNNVASLNSLLTLTSFENVKPFFSANVASCWLKVIQAQKERKHPQHLQHNETELCGGTLTWRLQRNKFSKKEHIFEITLPKSTHVGHLDLKFLLQASITAGHLAPIEITLYRARQSISHRDLQQKTEKILNFESSTPTSEFLKSMNAEVVCGPLDLGAFLDLSGSCGTVVMTSPTLILKKGRNFYLHVQAKGQLDDPIPVTPNLNTLPVSSDSSTTSSSSNKKPYSVTVDKHKAKFQGLKTHIKSSWGKDEFSVKFLPASLHFGSAAAGVHHSTHPHLANVSFAYSPTGGVPVVHTSTGMSIPSKLQTSTTNVNSSGSGEDKRKDLVGCDWLNEVSITIRQVKPSCLPNEEVERKALVTSESVFQSLLNVAVLENEEDSSYASQALALDLLVWVAAVNLSSPPVDNSSYQLKFIRAVEEKLEALVMQAILMSDRSTAHKCAKLLIMCIEASENYYKTHEVHFSSSLLTALLNLIRYVVSCCSAGALQWYFLLVNRVRVENMSRASQTLLSLLKEVSGELKRRTDPLHSLLRTRFGLYGTPFEPELFELEIPPVTKSCSHPLTYSGLYGTDAMNNLAAAAAAAGSGTFHLWGLKDIDFRDLLLGNPFISKWGKLGALSPKQQIQGLLEVEPLHFTCHAASDGTRIERIDLGSSASSFTAVPIPPAYQPTFTNLQTGEGSKKSEPDKMDQIMMLQNALKMESEVMFDYIDNGDSYKMIEMPYSNNPPDILAALSGLPPSVLTMVMKPSGTNCNTTTASNAPVYTHQLPMFQPAGLPALAFAASGPLPPTFVMPKPPPTSTTATTAVQQQPTPSKVLATVASSSNANKAADSAKSSADFASASVDNEGLRLLLSPWQKMMYIPPQQAIVIESMHSGARRFVVLDFGAPILLTDIIIPACSDLVSLSVDIWLHREDTDGQRLVVATDIGLRTLVVSDLQPSAMCRYLKITVIGRYGMGTTKCRIPLGLFYGHTTVLPIDVSCLAVTNNNPQVPVLNPVSIQAHLSVLSYLLEDIGCRYQLACTKLRRLLEPLLKPEISSIDHIAYYLPKGKERNKLGLNNSPGDQSIASAYQDCISLQQQLNVTRNVVKRLQKSLTLYTPAISKCFESLSEISTDKVHVLTEFLMESLLGISMFLSSAASPSSSSSSSSSLALPLTIYTQMDQDVCETLFRNICVLENGQCQLSSCVLMLRLCGFQPWWGKFLTSTLKSLFSSGTSFLFPQDRVFILLVYLGQKALLNWQNSRVLESTLELLLEILAPIENTHGFLSSKLDMTLLGWVIMYLCLCLDGVNCTFVSSPTDIVAGKKRKDFKDIKGASSFSSRWDFIQGESALYRKITGPAKPQEYSGFRRRIQKKMLATKQKLDDLDNITSGMTQPPHGQPMGLGSALSALGNKIEAIKQKQASIGKNIKLQSSKHFKDLLQIRRSEMLSKRSGLQQKEGKDEGPASDVEINLNLESNLCLQVTKKLGMLILRMDSTCHSDVFLITCKALARIATACRPVISLGSIFSSESLINLILNAVSSDFIRQRNWSSSWVSHAVMCLVQDVLEGEKLFPASSSSFVENKLLDVVEPKDSSLSVPITEDIMSGIIEDASSGSGGGLGTEEEILSQLNTSAPEDMSTDETDATLNESCNTGDAGSGAVPMDVCSFSEDSNDSDIEEISMHFAPQVEQLKTAAAAIQKSCCPSGKKINPCVTSISSALDARLESGIESMTEIRLRMLAVIDSEILNQALKAPIEVPSELLKNDKNLEDQQNQSSVTFVSNSSSAISSGQLLSECFEKIFQMMAAENCSISIEKVLQLWISINAELSGVIMAQDSTNARPLVPLSSASVSSLMSAFTKNAGIGVQEWGLAFQVLHLVSNQLSLSSTEGMWLYIMSDKCFPEMILRFISGTGMRLQKNHIVSAGPTVCQHFYNFLLRLRQLSADTPWTTCLKEILLRVLSLFLSGPFIASDFPIDAFNKFLDRLTCPDLSYVNPATVISLMQQMAQILHQYIFSPSKLKVKPGGEMKSLHSTCSSNNNNGDGDIKPAKPHTFDHVMFRLTCFMASFVSLPYKTTSSAEKTVQDFLSQMARPFHLTECENALVHYVAKCGNLQPKTIADIVLQMESTMMRILSVLANPNHINVLVSGDLAAAFNIMETSVPTTVVDAVIHVFCKLQTSASCSKWVIHPIFKFLAKTPYDDFCCPFIVSETFVLMVLKVISGEENLQQFAELKCVEAICNKFVVSARRFFSSCPTFVSILTQYIGRTDVNALFGAGGTHKKLNNEPIEIQEGQINVAPLGTISSTNFSAHPSEVLLQATPPHRRARSPVWSYHFFPEETYLELVISLPCAVLLREVHVIPHMTSLSTCPSAVMVEISRDQSTSSTLPMGPPVNTSGMSNIIIQLVQPEVAKTVLLRLFKPKDSSNLGLSQIRLLGSTTFSEAALQGLSTLDSIKNFESSAHWLYILDRAIQVSSDSNQLLCRRIIETAVSIPDVLESCYSMLIAPVGSGKAQDIYLPHVASVLFHLGCLRYDVSKQLMEALLGPVQMGFTNGMGAASLTAAGLSQLSIVVELLHKLCCDIPQWGINNLMTIVNWLENCADSSGESVHLSVAAPEYFQAFASALWQITSVGKTDMSDICTAKLLTKLCKWALKLDGGSELKIALDHIMCSMCYYKPWLFILLLTRMQVLKPMDWMESVSSPIEDMIYQWYEEESTWERLQLEDVSVIRSVLTPTKLMTIGRVSQSPMASKLLHQSNFLGLLNTCIMDFWTYFTAKCTNPSEQKDTPTISSEFLVSVLAFYSELCNVNYIKGWFGKQGSEWWLPLLKLLSSLPGPVKAAFFGANKTVYELETVVIQFLAKCCWSHPENQKIIAACLRDIIVSQKTSPHKAVFLHSMSSFCRRLLIQLLLENEKVVVQVKSSSKYPLKVPPNTLLLRDKHPSMGVNGGDRLFFISTQSTAYDLIKLIEPHGVQVEKLAIAAAEPNRFLSMLKKEQGLIEASLDMIDQMQLAMQSGNAAKDKRTLATVVVESNKRPIKTASKKLKAEGGTASSDSSSVKMNSSDVEKINNNKGPTLVLEIEDFPDVKIPGFLAVATLLAAVRQQKHDAFFDVLVFNIRTETGTVFPSRATALSPSASSSSMTDTTLDELSNLGGESPPCNTCTSLLVNRDKDAIPGILCVEPLPSTVEVFSKIGGLGLLAKHLPIVYPETLKQIAVGTKGAGSTGTTTNVEKDSPMGMADEWVKVETAEDFYDEMLDSMVASTPLAKRAPGVRQINITPGIPPHSMAAFGLFLSLPRFSEILLGERVGAQCMLRLVMGVTDDADGNDIFNSAVAKTLPTLPFEVLRLLLDCLPLTSLEGQTLRRVMVDIHGVHFILACLAIFTHQNCDASLIPGLQHELVIAATKAQTSGYTADGKNNNKSDDKSHVYWAKGTGFGTGSTAQSWDVEMAIQKKKNEEENITCLLHLMSSYINPRKPNSQQQQQQSATPPNDQSRLPEQIIDLLRNSCLFDAIAGYLRNDSVLDMSRHVPLYKSVLEFLRALVSSPQLLPLLAPWERKVSKTTSEDQCVSKLLSKMKDVVDNYSKRLTCNLKGTSKSKNNNNNNNKNNTSTNNKQVVDELDDEGLAVLIPDIQKTAIMVEEAINELAKHRQPDDIEMLEESMEVASSCSKSLEDRYVDEMKKLQFAFYEMITEDEESDNPNNGGIRFTVPYHYETNVRNSWGRNSAARLKRLAQESVTLSSSLPIAHGSTIFVRSDNDRLDVMKVLITGPAGTPYANGCFEFDVFFPNDYPQSPMLINLETNGRQRVRFNPNLYNDGKVCLSILNTWHGRPEEKWNPQTSSLLPVLVAIQSLILNAEPYFNEPGYEKSRGTEQGERNNREYNVGIQIAAVEWAMLDQLRHPSPCFKDVIQRHFWMKRGEIITQLDKWLQEVSETCKNDRRAGKSVVGAADPVQVFKNNFALLKKEFMNMKAPPGLEDLADLYSSDGQSEASSFSPTTQSSSSSSSSAQSTPNSTIACTMNKSQPPQQPPPAQEESLSTPTLTPPPAPAPPPPFPSSEPGIGIEEEEEEEEEDDDDKMSVDV